MCVLLQLQEASTLVDAKLHSPSMDALLHKKLTASKVRGGRYAVHPLACLLAAFAAWLALHGAQVEGSVVQHQLPLKRRLAV